MLRWRFGEFLERRVQFLIGPFIAEAGESHVDRSADRFELITPSVVRLSPPIASRWLPESTSAVSVDLQHFAIADTVKLTLLPFLARIRFIAASSVARSVRHFSTG